MSLNFLVSPLQLPTKQIVECFEELFHVPAIININDLVVIEGKGFLHDVASSGSELYSKYVSPPQTYRLRPLFAILHLSFAIFITLCQSPCNLSACTTHDQPIESSVNLLPTF